VVYEIPSTFSREVEIEFDRPDCPPVELRWNRRLFRVPVTGRLCISSPLQTGWSHDEFWLVDRNGNRQAITDFPVKDK
jgi:hypothetical protein